MFMIRHWKKSRNVQRVMGSATLAMAALAGTGVALSSTPAHASTPARTAASTKSRPHFRARYLSFPVKGLSRAQILQESRLTQTVPLWSGTTTSPVTGTTKYSYVMVGKNPAIVPSTGTANSVIPTDVVPVQIYLEGTTPTFFDPTVPDPACGLTTSALTRTLKSPLFQSHSYTAGKIPVGDVQYESAFMRENFAKFALPPTPTGKAKNPTYGIQLNGTGRAPVSIFIPSSDGQILATGCGPLGGLNLNTWDPFVQTALIPYLQAHGYTSPTHMLVLLFMNVVMYENDNPSECCVLGYHSGVSTPHGVQYYAVADYDASGLFKGSDDVSALSHELGEWMNDPNGNNATPAWGHIGQVQGCQSNLEVGDPLSGTTVPVAMNGVTYHPQELAFFSWFFRQSPSIGVNGWYSSNGTFTKGAGAVC
jgi:hypothetical protein